MELIKIDLSNSYLIKDFLKNAGDSLTTFRYYKKRGLEAINNHLVTYIGSVDSSIVAYGHLDKNDEIIWLGIAVAESYKGKGYGKIMMNHLISFAKKNRLPRINLSVDSDNISARSLYETFGFVQQKVEHDICYYRLIL